MGLVKVNPSFVNRVFDEFLHAANTPHTVNRRPHNTPAVNVQETDDDFRLEVAAPGFEKGDFKVEVNEGVLTIAVNKEQKETADKKPNFTRREFRAVNFSRRFTLPETANDASISATYHNGILSVVLPKKEEAKPQPARLIAIG